ncbi:MAG: hypothetical protein CENE_03284 [Candidatus Celerinatantimonas neptuna]|nr:MAG: hypothetical protein CENE_03284 [Candidatus Celerinatantimonas neptuna]
MDELLKAMASMGFTLPDILIAFACIQQWRLLLKMDERITRLEIKDKLKETQHGN